jgi:hypothetical protein
LEKSPFFQIGFVFIKLSAKLTQLRIAETVVSKLKIDNDKMIIDELKEKGINSRDKVIDYLSQNENGLYFLPDNLTGLIAQITKSYSPKSCINLNSNIGEIISKCSDIGNCFGLESNVQNIKLCKYLFPNVITKNLYPLDYSTKQKFDAVICYPQLGQRIDVDGRKVHSEKLFVSKSLELLDANGTAILLLPNSFLTLKVFEGIREDITCNYGIRRIITLPRGAVNQYIPIGFSLVEITTQEIEETEFIAIQSKHFSFSDINGKLPDFVISKEYLTKRWDYHFHNPAHKAYEKELYKFETKKIEELVEITKGVHLKSDEKLNSGNYQIITPKNISKGKFELSKKDKFVNKPLLNNREKQAVLRAGDIVFSQFNINGNKIEIYIHELNDNRFIANTYLTILRGENAEYVATYLNTKNGLDLFNQQVDRHNKGMIFTNISIDDLKGIQIPILPLEDLELASKRKLEKLSYEELLKINQNYISLKLEFNALKKENIISPHEAQLNSMQETLMEVLNTQKKIATKLDDIQSTLVELTNDFKQIKDLPRDIDEKIIRLNENLDSKLENLLKDQKQIDFYIKEIKRWFDFYDILEIKSQKYLPEAEYIFDHISKLDNPDYSPFILQYCRALENELLKKIFRAYVQSLIDKNIDIEKDFSWDFGHKESGKLNNENTSKLAKHLQRCLRKPKEEWFFELGSMEMNLRYLTGKTVEKSSLLQNLKSFVLLKFKQEFLNIEYLDEIKTIIRDYRNQSAHPNLIGAEKALKFHKQVKECLISLMENYKQ